MTQDLSVRLNKYISESGICSRREADKFIEKKVVFLNGRCAKMGDQVHPGDIVKINGIIIEPKDASQNIYILFNKPVGITSTTDTSDKDNIISYIKYGERIFPVGRLDKDSQGLIMLTNNGDIVNKILRAGNLHEKEYIVTVDKPVTEQFIKNMSNGVPILGVNTKKCKVEAINQNTFRIVLIQGMNRQIRRMCEHFNYEVLRLERVRMMNFTLKGIPVGEYRELKKTEIDELNELIAQSSDTPNSNTSVKKKTATKSTVVKASKVARNNPDNRKSTLAKSGTSKSINKFGSSKSTTKSSKPGKGATKGNTKGRRR